MRLRDCHNFHDFRNLAKRRLPAPIFDYIDGAADDEVTVRQNSASFDRCDLVPNVLRGVETIDLSVTVNGMDRPRSRPQRLSECVGACQEQEYRHASQVHRSRSHHHRN